MVEITKEDFTKLEENLGRVIAKGFDENTEQHRKILEILDKHAVMLINHTEILKNHTEILKNHTERLTRIEAKLEGIVYRKEFEELKTEVERIKEVLAMKKKS